MGGGGDQALGAQPAQIVYHIVGALASQLTDRRARIDQQSCFILATNELDEGRLSAQAVLDGYKGQARAERGFRFLKDPQFLASSLYLKKPERVMALLMVMTVCLLVYAALEYRIRNALKDHGATFPDQKRQARPEPDRTLGVPLLRRIHVLSIPGQGLLVLNLTDEHQHLLQLPGKAVCVVLSIKMHSKQALGAECSAPALRLMPTLCWQVWTSPCWGCQPVPQFLL